MSELEGERASTTGRKRKAQLEHSSIPERFLCPLSQHIMENPVICSDTRTYEKNNIEQWLALNCVSPKTGEVLSNKKLKLNVSLKSELARFDWQAYVRKTYKVPFQVNALFY